MASFRQMLRRCCSPVLPWSIVGLILATLVGLAVAGLDPSSGRARPDIVLALAEVPVAAALPPVPMHPDNPVDRETPRHEVHPLAAQAALAPVEAPAAPGPRVAIVLTGLGLDPALASAAGELAKAVALGWSVYADDPLPEQAEMRRRGREIWLELPVSLGDPARFDAGPLALSPAGSTERNLERLNGALTRGSDLAGVLAQPGAFASEPVRFSPLADLLRERGLALLFHGVSGQAVLRASASAGGPSQGVRAADGSLEVTTLPVVIDEFLDGLAERAIRAGSAVGVLRAHPLTIVRLLRWQDRIAGRGLTLVPPSMLLRLAPDPVVAAGTNRSLDPPSRADEPGQGG